MGEGYQTPRGTQKGLEKTRNKKKEKSSMNTDYKQLFGLIEESLVCSSDLPKEEFLRELGWTPHGGDPARWNDAEIFWTMAKVVFFSGLRSDMVEEKLPAIKRRLYDYRIVKDWKQAECDAYMNDRGVIRNKQKLEACVHNARGFHELLSRFGSFVGYIDSKSFENIPAIKMDLMQRFRYLGPRTVYHFMMELGLSVIKPDRAVCRIFHRLGLIDNPDEWEKAVEIGGRFAEATGYKIRYIDGVFAKFGQVSSDSMKIVRGVCLEKKPSCDLCSARPHCNYGKAM